MNNNSIHLAIFASGSGTNAENIIRYFQKHDYKFKIYCNNPHAGVLKRAQNLSVPFKIFNQKDFYQTDSIIQDLIEQKIDLIVLAGFLWLIPEIMVKKFEQKIINIHPAILPNYGGKGMYGMHVHQAVYQDFISGKINETGITIHWVNEKYDEGKYILQVKCPLQKGDNPETIAQKVHELEYKYYPLVIENILNNPTCYEKND